MAAHSSTLAWKIPWMEEPDGLWSMRLRRVGHDWATELNWKAMAPHSSTLAWKIPWMEEPDGLQSMGSLRVRHDSDFTFTFHFHALEKEMATHSSVLAWRIPGTGELGGLPSMGSHRVGHDWSDLAAAAVAEHSDEIILWGWWSILWSHVSTPYLYCQNPYEGSELGQSVTQGSFSYPTSHLKSWDLSDLDYI